MVSISLHSVLAFSKDGDFDGRSPNIKPDSRNIRVTAPSVKPFLVASLKPSHSSCYNHCHRSAWCCSFSRFTVLSVFLHILMSRLQHISNKHTIFLWIRCFLTLVLNSLLCTPLCKPMNLNIPSGTHNWNGEFYSVVTNINFTQRRKLGSVFMCLLSIPWHTAFAQYWHLG